MKKFVIYSHENYFLPIVTKMKAPFIWADMTKEACEPDEAKPLKFDTPLPDKAPEKAWEDWFAVKLEERRQLMGKNMLIKHHADEVTERLLAMPADKRKDVVVIFDFNHGTKYGEQLKQAGFDGIFAQDWAYDLERKREKASQLVQKYYKQVGIPRQFKFGTNSADKMIQFIDKHSDVVWVVKPNGVGIWVYCPISEDGPVAAEQAINHIEANKNDINAIPMILQEKIIGTEINIETCYSKGTPVFSMVDLENKFMHPEEVGHQSGCAFDLVFPVDLQCELRRLCNAPFDPLAKKLNFTGLMDMNAILSSKDGKPYFIEFCPNRFGYNALFTEIELSGQTPEDYLLSMIEGTTKLPEKIFGASVKLFNEDHYQDFYDSIFKPDYQKVEVQLAEPNLDSIWCFDVYKDKDKYWLSHYSNEAIVVTAHSDSPEGAVEKAKLKAERCLSFDGKYLRSDIDEFDRLYNPVYRYRVLRDRKLLEVKDDRPHRNNK